MSRPGVPAPNLIPLMGIEDLREKGGVHYRELQARTLLNRCDSPRMPLRWTVNPYRGCAMGCRYCYAAYTHEFMGMATPEEFHSTVYVKRGHEARTAADLARLVRKRERIALGAATDPYQPGEAEARVTRRFLEMVAQHRGARLGITTKGALVLRDLDLLKRISERSSLSVHVSLNSPHAGLLRRIEPLAPPPEVRIEVTLEAEFPRCLEAYRNAYQGRVYLGGRYRERIRETIARLKAKHGFVDAGDDDAPRAAEQLPLW